MNTLVERLRKVDEDYDFHGNALIYEAATAIEALQGENERLDRETADLAMLADQYKAERDKFQAVSDEYNAWIRCHAAGGDYDDFLKKILQASRGAK